MNYFRNQYGFTMLPLILFLFVIVGLVSAGMLMVGPKAQLGKLVDTKTGLEKSAAAIISWSTANGRLPLNTEFAATLPNQKDSWGNNLLYIYDNNLTSKTTGGICGRNSTAIIQGTTPIAFLLLSRGADNQIDSVPNTTGAYTGNLNGLNFADIYHVVTLEDLKTSAGCYGPTQGRLRILNNELPKACISSPYSATIFASGGVAPYPTYTITGLPAGISASGSTISGTPSSTGTSPISILIIDSQTPTANSVQKNLNLVVTACGSPPPPPTAAWNFDEGSGNSIGSGSTLGTITGTPNWVTRGSGTALSLNGTNNYIYFNDLNYFNIGTGNVTLSAWVNFSGMPKQSWCDPVTHVDMAIGAIAGKGFLYPSVGYGMYVTQTRQCTSCTVGCGTWSDYKVAFQLRNPASDVYYVTSDSTITSGTWTHIAAVLDRSATPATDQIKMYINGIKQPDTSNDREYSSMTALNFDNNFKFTIGSRHGGGSSYAFPYWGLIDDVQFYKSALTDAQLNSVYVTGQTP